MYKAKALQQIEIAQGEWEETWGSEFAEEHGAHVNGLLDLAHEAFERDDWTGAWMWAGNAIGFIRERLAPQPAIA
jgi:hypothetical protein